MPKVNSRPIFESAKSLVSKFQKHREEFGDITIWEYLERAQKFFNRKAEGSLEELVRSDGSVSRYDAETNEFLVKNPDGTIKMYFLPESGRTYWEVEHERNSQ